MELVARDVERQTARSDVVTVGDAPPQPRLGIEPEKQRDGSVPDGLIIRQQLVHRPRVEGSHLRVGLLFEPGKWTRISARDAQRTVGVDALVVGEMAEHLPDRPLAGAVSQKA